MEIGLKSETKGGPYEMNYLRIDINISSISWYDIYTNICIISMDVIRFRTLT